MNAWEKIKEKSYTTPEKMTALEWALWNGRANNPDSLLEQAAEEIAALREALEAMYISFGSSFPDGESTAVDMARAALLTDFTE